MAMFTCDHVLTYRTEALEAVSSGDVVRLLALYRPLEPHQERVGEDFLRGCCRDQHDSSQASQPHVRAVAGGG